MSLVRIAAFNRIKKEFDSEKVKFIATVHDDIELDVDNDDNLIYNISILLEDVFKDIPKLYEKFFKHPFNVQMAGEVSYGPNLSNMITFKREETICKFK